MPIDTAVKRRASAQARLWFLRRTIPAPTGAVTTSDRQGLARSYAGIEVSALIEANATSTVNVAGPATSTPSVAGPATSTLTVAAPAASTPTVSDG